MNPFLDLITQRLQTARDEDRFRHLRAVKPCPGGRCEINGNMCVDFSSNDYLGLAEHPALIRASQRWSERLGAGSRGSRLVTGTVEETLFLEARIALWKGTEGALILGSGYNANVGLLRAFAEKGALFIGDKLNHASLNLGCQSVGVEFKRYKHNDLNHLESILKNATSTPLKLIVSDTVFSMDGDIADVPALRALAEKYNAMLYLDDAHASGLFNVHGKGLGGSHAPYEIVMGTCSKAFGSYGAYVGCSATLRDFFINSCSSFIYTTALPPAVHGAIHAALDIFQSDEGAQRCERVFQHAQTLCQNLKTLGFDTGDTVTPIVPVMMGENATAVAFSQKLLDAGFLGVAIRSPTVPLHKARLRLSVSAAHSANDITALIEFFKIVEPPVLS